MVNVHIVYRKQQHSGVMFTKIRLSNYFFPKIMPFISKSMVEPERLQTYGAWALNVE